MSTNSIAALDRRAATAVAELDRRVGDLRVPPMPPDLHVGAEGGARPRARRDAYVLAAAAALVVVGLIVALVAVDRGRDEVPVATTPAVRHLVLPAERAAAYGQIVAVDGAAASPDTSSGAPAPILPDEILVRLHVPIGDDAPWPQVVFERDAPGERFEDQSGDGALVDVGGPVAALEVYDPWASVVWETEDGVRSISSRTDPETLVELVRQIVADGGRLGEPLPGHEVLFVGGLADVVPTFAVLAGALPADVSSIAYLDATGASNPTGLVITTAPGSAARWRAAQVLADEIERLTVRGVDAVLARFAGGIVEVSWLEDGTLVRVTLFGGDDVSDGRLATVLDEIEHLVAATPAEWAALLAAHPADASGSTDGAFSTVGEVVGGPVESVGDLALVRRWSEEAALDPDHLAGTELHQAEFSARAVVRRDATGGRILLGEILGRSRGATTESPLPAPDAPSWYELSEDTHLAVYGVMPPEVVLVRLVRADGAEQPAWAAAMSGAEPNLFLLVVDGATDLESIDVVELVATRLDGSELRVPLY